MCPLHLEYFAKGLHLHRILKINHVFTAYIKRIILFSGIVLSSFAVSAEETETVATTTTEETHTDAHKADEKFNPTPMILHHVADSHEWHIVGGLTIPLPCIVIHDGLNVFLSNKMPAAHHGETAEVAGNQHVTDTIVTTGTVKGFNSTPSTNDTIVVYENELNGRTVQQAIRDKMKNAAQK